MGFETGSSNMMAKRIVQITAPSRLHFGLISFADQTSRQFGGAGVMLNEPCLRLEVVPSPHFQAGGLMESRIEAFAKSWAKFHHLAELPQCTIQVKEIPPQHVGLGVGTQLGLSVAAGLHGFLDTPMPSPAELAMSVGRGLRSAVGTYGFAQGGLIAERGKMPGELIAPLDCRLEVPSQWRFVLMRPGNTTGISGSAEQKAFSDLQAVPKQIADQLREELRQNIFPAAASGQFEKFSQSVYAYGKLSGSCFADIQGGPYSGPQAANLVEKIRSWGIQGVGQSSWGPTLFAILPNQQQAEEFVARLSEDMPGDESCFFISAANNDGATLEVRTG